MSELDPKRASDRTAFAREIEEQRSQVLGDTAQATRMEVCQFWQEDADSIVRFRLQQYAAKLQIVAGNNQRLAAGAALITKGFAMVDKAVAEELTAFARSQDSVLIDDTPPLPEDDGS